MTVNSVQVGYSKAMGFKHPPKVKEAALYLRQDKRFSITDLEQTLKVNKTTLCEWLKRLPLTKEERYHRGGNLIYTTSQKKSALYLRQEKRLSVNEIEQALGINRNTLCSWFSNLPLTATEQSQRSRQRMLGTQYALKAKGQPSKHSTTVKGPMSIAQKGRLAEAAVLYRLALHDFEVYGRVFDGQKADWLVVGSQKQAFRIQVRWAAIKRPGRGLPTASLATLHGNGRLSAEDFDFLVAYDFRTDTAYVFACRELEHLRRSVTVKPEAAEAFWKLR